MKSLTGLQLPVDIDETNADLGFAKLVARSNGFFRKDHNGNMHKVFEWDDPTIFVQPNQPTYDGVYIWIQTNINNDHSAFTFWFEDGVN